MDSHPFSKRDGYNFMMHPIRAFIFDLDGTLVDSYALVFGAFQYAVEPYGIQFSPEDLEELRSKTQDTLFLKWLSPKDNEEALKRLTHFSVTSVDRVKIVPGLKEVLSALHEKGYLLAVWTGRDRHSAQEILKHTGLAPYFRFVQGGCDVDKNKPHPEGLLRLIAKFKISPAEVVVVGDHAHDIQGALEAGATALHAAWHYVHPETEKSPHRPSQKFTEVSQFLAWINQNLPANLPLNSCSTK